jgi:hypothetical protein
MNVKQLFEYYKLEDTTQQFTGHAIALQFDDSYMLRPAKEIIELIKVRTEHAEHNGGEKLQLKAEGDRSRADRALLLSLMSFLHCFCPVVFPALRLFRRPLRQFSLHLPPLWVVWFT